eukprot:106540_1
MATKTPLLTEKNDADAIDIEYITNLHSEQIECGATNNHNQRELVTALGGVDSILQHYLQHKLVNTKQLKTIHSILTKDSSNIDDTSDKEFPIYGTIVFNSSNTFLHSIFSEYRAQQIINFLYHRITA